ncbi:MAG: hypothetical protein H6Q75_471 [Firmicutes bacterium]|nr:hypothetical protein [Bacillota bacterium]
MNTFHHGFWLYYFTQRHPKVIQIVLGSMAPDYIYFLLVAVLMTKGLLGWSDLPALTPAMFMSYLPQYPWAVYIDLMGHSAVVWGAMGIVSLFRPFQFCRPFMLGWGTHIFIDGLTHAAHANFFLYPLSMVAVHSPVSFWDPKYFAHEFRLVNGTLITLAVCQMGYSWWKGRKKE